MTQTRTALITGGASGIGAACTRHFVAKGWDVAVNYFSAERLMTGNLVMLDCGLHLNGG